MGVTREVRILVRRFRVPLEPPAEIFHVQVERGDGVWEETLPTREQLAIFIQGVRAGVAVAATGAYVSFPVIPEKAEPLPSVP